MTAKHSRRLEDYLRRYGLEGDAAFYAVAYHYQTYHADNIGSIPPAIVEKWRVAHTRIARVKHVTMLLDEIVEQDPYGDRLSEWYQFFIGRRFREASGKFFTPRPIASAMARLLPLRPDAVIMDPTCGAGTFLVEASRCWGQTSCTLVANDIDRDLIELALLTLSLATPSHHNKQFHTDDIFATTNGRQGWRGQIDYILANPPFSLPIEHEQFGSPLFSCGYRNSDALFIDATLELLRPGGRLVCLLPHSIVANQDFAELRTQVEKFWDLLGVISLPEGVFHLSAGTTTRADIVIMQKKCAGEQAKKRVFASVPSVGICLNRRSRALCPNDLDRLLANPQVEETLLL